jgi:hypothetical protein
MLVIKLRSEGAVPKVAKRTLNKSYKAAFQSAGLHWHRRYSRKHFTAAGAREYGYSPRQGERMGRGTKRFRKSYTGRKLRLFGHVLPLVWSGASRLLARIRDARSTSKGVRVLIHARTLNRPRKGGKKSMREEMTTISDREERRLKQQIGETLTRRFARIRTKSTKRL